MADQIWADCTNEEMDLDLLFEVLIDPEEDLDWRAETKEILADFIAEKAEEAVFYETFEPFQGHLIREFWKEATPITLITLREAQVNENHEEWTEWFETFIMELDEEKQLRWELVQNMWNVEWFNNEFTRGCYGDFDFWEDLDGIDMEELKKLREMQEEGADKTAYDEWVERLY